MANNELKWSADEIADACVKAGLGILECHSLMVTLKATPPVATPAQAEPSDALRGNIELVIARLEQIADTSTRHGVIQMAEEALACAKAIESRIRGQQGGSDAADAADAARWRAFVGSARIKPQGSAGLSGKIQNNYAHMGLEIWTTYDRDYTPTLLEQMDRETALGREWLTKYADIAIAAIQAQAGDAPGGAA